MNEDDFLRELLERRLRWVQANEENEFAEGLKRLLSQLYPQEAHFIYELLQNAEDTGATWVSFQLSNDALRFSHNGAVFEPDHVKAITSIGQSSKRTDVNAIGKFGVGFKAVFAITETPRITSGAFSFEIRDLVCPHPHARLSPDFTVTVFEFPFNHSSKDAKQCRDEVLAGLKAIRDSVLLFLRKIQRVRWQSDGSSKVVIERFPRSTEILEIVRDNQSGSQSGSSLWLRFEEPAKLFPARTIAVACKLEFRSGQAMLIDERPLAQQVKIAETDDQLHVFFAVEKEQTGLRFHLHGPYSTTVARDSIPHNSDNRTLLVQTAGLVAKSLERIRDLGLLDRECLNVLPNSRDKLNEFFAPVREKVLAALREKPLVPTQGDVHAPAKVLCPGFRGIDEVLGSGDLAVLLKRPGIQWAIRVAVDTNAAQLLRDLEMPDMGWKELFECITARFGSTHDEAASRWLATKDDEWVRRFYEMLHNVVNELGYFDKDEVRAAVRKWSIVRLEKGEHRTAIGTFFPLESAEENEFPTVRRAVLESPEGGGGAKNLDGRRISKARYFLIAIGVREVDERARIENLLAKHYATATPRPSWEDHVLHLRRFVAWWKQNKDDTEFLGHFQRAAIFAGEGHATWLRPQLAYLDKPIRETGLAALYSLRIQNVPVREALDARYATAGIEALVDFTIALGVKHELTIQKVKTDRNQDHSILHRPGDTHTNYETDVDYLIEYCAEIVGANRPELAALVWRTMCGARSAMLQAQYSPNKKTPTRTAPSRLIHVLRSHAWLPDNAGKWRKPADMTRGELLSEFPYDDGNGWLTAIGFGASQSQKSKEKNERRKTAESVGIPGDLLDALEGFSSAERTKEVERIVEELKRRQRPVSEPVQAADFPTELQKAVNRPGKMGPFDPPANSDPISDPARRALRLDAEIKDARDNERPAGERQRATTRTIWEAKDPQTRAFLVQEYAGHCQVCGETFRQRDGSPYFEAVHFVSRTHEGMAWADRSGNALCLCPTCCAKFKFGAVESGDFIEQVKSLKLRAEGGSGGLKVRIRLCGEEVFIQYEERHLLELRQMLDASKAPPSDTLAQSPPARIQLVQCPHCLAKVRSDRLDFHIQRIHGNGGSGGQPRHGIRKTATDDMTQRTRCRDCGRPAMPGDDRCYSCA